MLEHRPGPGYPASMKQSFLLLLERWSHWEGLRSWITATLVYLVLFDLVLVTWVFTAPELWFTVWHGVPGDDSAGFLKRCGANWAAFLLFQSIALWRWKREPWWLVVVAGVRLSDIFTDLTVSMVAHDLTWTGAVLLPAGSLMNLVLGSWLICAWHMGEMAAARGR